MFASESSRAEQATPCWARIDLKFPLECKRSVALAMLHFPTPHLPPLVLGCLSLSPLHISIPQKSGSQREKWEPVRRKGNGGRQRERKGRGAARRNAFHIF